jgi:hypothetical protein
MSTSTMTSVRPEGRNSDFSTFYEPNVIGDGFLHPQVMAADTSAG